MLSYRVYLKPSWDMRHKMKQPEGWTTAKKSQLRVSSGLHPHAHICALVYTETAMRRENTTIHPYRKRGEERWREAEAERHRGESWEKGQEDGSGFLGES